KIEGKEYKLVPGQGRQLIDASNSVVWARCYEIGTDRPIFGDRDKSIHDTVDEISRERRNGYSWYGDSGKRALEVYAKWSQTYPR
ncbi:MAG TPA: pectate lyase, partial [Candidatus Binatus sp.]|nr:pectate lyase [Candidatus Binatus sp.]